MDIKVKSFIGASLVLNTIIHLSETLNQDVQFGEQFCRLVITCLCIANLLVNPYIIMAIPFIYLCYDLAKIMETCQRELHNAISPSLVESTAGSVTDWIRDKQLSQFLLAVLVVQHCSNDVITILENGVTLLKQSFDEEVDYIVTIL